eukprot:GHVL01032944.1.p2 GENE.GHVL01032944.1~~GHVL01032944.1.p2  ORF type:complete len:214 (+),score=13.81 GHVL01032944.1:162-803(+)
MVRIGRLDIVVVFGGYEGWSVRVQASLQIVEDRLVAVNDVVLLLRIGLEVVERVGRTVVQPSVDVLRLLGYYVLQLGRYVPALGGSSVSLDELVATATDGGVVAHLVHVVDELLARSGASAQQVLPLTDAVNVGHGAAPASRLHQRGVPVRDVDQLFVRRVRLLQEARRVHESRRSGAALPESDLGSSQRIVAGVLMDRPAVVRGEENEGVVH